MCTLWMTEMGNPGAVGRGFPIPASEDGRRNSFASQLSSPSAIKTNMHAFASSTQRVSVYDVARLANTSIATVSNVVNDKGRVGLKKKNEVLRAIKKLGYQVNSFGRNLRLKRSATVGLLFFPTSSRIFKNPFYEEVMDGLQEELTRRGYHLLLANYEVAGAEYSIPRFLLQGKVDGMILMGGFPSSIARGFGYAQAPLILLDSNVEHPIDSVVSDGFSAEIQVVEHLVSFGHREIVMLAYSKEDYNTDLRVQGFLAGLEQFGLRGEGQVMRNAFSHDEIYNALCDRLRGPQSPTAIVAVNDTLAMVMIDRLRKDGIRVPHDLSVVGYDDDDIELNNEDFLTTVRVNKKELGRTGAELMIKRILSPLTPVVKLRLPVEFVSRKSVARLEHSPADALNGKIQSQSLHLGFSLIEVALALSLASFCVVTLLGLLPIALRNFQQADNQSAMVNLATSVAQDLNSTAQSANVENSSLYALSIPSSGGSSTSPQTIFVDASGDPTTGPNYAGALYRVTVAFVPPATGSKTATSAQIMITFPAQVNFSTGAWPTNYMSMLQMSVSLNRN